MYLCGCVGVCVCVCVCICSAVCCELWQMVLLPGIGGADLTTWGIQAHLCVKMKHTSQILFERIFERNSLRFYLVTIRLYEKSCLGVNPNINCDLVNFKSYFFGIRLMSYANEPLADACIHTFALFLVTAVVNVLVWHTLLYRCLKEKDQKQQDIYIVFAPPRSLKGPLSGCFFESALLLHPLLLAPIYCVPPSWYFLCVSSLSSASLTSHLPGSSKIAHSIDSNDIALYDKQWPTSFLY